MKVFLSLVLTLVFSWPCLAEGPYFGTGIKIGEVTQDEAIVWVRLTKNKERVGNDVPMPTVKYFDPETGEPINKRRPKQGRPELTFPEGLDVNTIQGAVPGMEGVVRIRYQRMFKVGAKEGTPGDWITTKWRKVKPEDDFTYQFKLKNLSPNYYYYINLECKSSKSSTIVTDFQGGGFKTAPTADQQVPVSFMVTTGTAYMDKDLDEGYRFTTKC